MGGQWYTRRRDEFPAEAPNRYFFRLTGVHFLMARALGPLLPPLAEAGPFLNEQHPTWKARSAKGSGGIDAETLFVEWLKKMSKSDSSGLLVDLRKPYALEDIDESEIRRWRILDVATMRDVVNWKLN